MLTSLVTGATGQDASYLIELLLSKGYLVIGVSRRTSTPNTWRLKNCLNNPNFKLVYGDVTDPGSLQRIFRQYPPDEVYNLAAQSFVGESYNQPALTWRVVAEGCLNLLEIIRADFPATRFYQASSSEMFGDSYSTREILENINGNSVRTSYRFQNEQTPFKPRSPYAVAKLAAHNMVHTYRESYGLFAVAGILFNHESPRRGDEFVTKKITNWMKLLRDSLNGKGFPVSFTGTTNYTNDDLRFERVEISDTNKLRLGNILSSRDWGHARDYVQAMWLMLQQEKPKDYVVATGETHTVKEFLYKCFDKIGVDRKAVESLFVIDKDLYRPSEVDYLCGDSSLAQRELGWKPKTSFDKLIDEMLYE